ncbi:nephrin-like isoform X1 [Mytilus galloprovincialis]|uniref:nephrin-like isoform X1 n=1 Tax=Mytilus galloprovincialis TaxID=29158 RepID=UPI003F7C4279
MELPSYLLFVSIIYLHSRIIADVKAAGNGTESDPLQQYVSHGREAVLQCIFQESNIKWVKKVNDTFILIAKQNDVTNIQKYKVSSNPSTEHYSRLHVLNAQPDDEVIYRCSGLVNQMYHIQLNLYVPPTRLYFFRSIANKLEVMEGTDLLIRCIAEGGKPPPDLSILNSSRPNQTQEISFIIPTISRDYHQKQIVCDASSDALESPMRVTVQINLYLKPLTPKFNTNEVSTEETIPLRVSCISYGSRPTASFTWNIGRNDVTSFSKSKTEIADNGTKTVVSTLTYSVNKSNNEQTIICRASNIVGSVSASKTLDVKYAPDIAVNSPTYTQNDAVRTVTCNHNGNPDYYIYHKWQQKSRYGELIREFNGNKTLKLPDVSPLLRHQDTGEYVCTSSNGIKDKDSGFEQTGSGFMTVNAQPVFSSDTNERFKFFGELDKAVNISVNVYSLPKFTSFGWTRNGKPITTQNLIKYESSSYPTIVSHNFHGKEVQLEGYSVTLRVYGLTAEDFTIYTLTLTSGFGNIIKSFSLESSSVPETPGNFSKTDSAATSVTVQWDPRSSGGYKQTFYMQYRVQGLLEWITVIVGEEDINELKRRRTYKLRNLKEVQAYELKMYAENTAEKRSNVTDVLIIFTENAEPTTSSAVIGAVSGVLVTLVIACVSVIAIILFKRRQGKNLTEQNDKYYENTGFQDIPKGDDYEEVENKCVSDVEHKQSNKTYESLGTKDAPNVYDDLENAIGQTSSKTSLSHYEALNVQDKPSIYAELKN